MVLPSGENAPDRTVLGPSPSQSSLHEGTSHSQTKLSAAPFARLLQATSVCPSGAKARALTQNWTSARPTSVLLPRSQRRTVPSTPPDASSLLSGEKAR